MNIMVNLFVDRHIVSEVVETKMYPHFRFVASFHVSYTGFSNKMFEVFLECIRDDVPCCVCLVRDGVKGVDVFELMKDCE